MAFWAVCVFACLGKCVRVHMSMRTRARPCADACEYAGLGVRVSALLRGWGGCLPARVHVSEPGVGVYVRACVLGCSRLGVWACRLGAWCLHGTGLHGGGAPMG